MGRDMSTRYNMMGQDISSINKMGQGLNNMMGRDISSRNNMMGSDMSFRNNMVGHDMSINQMSQEMSSNLMGRDRYSKQMLSSNTMGLDMNRVAPLNTMSQRMQIETMPSQSLNRFF